MWFYPEFYDVIVIGAGHAGCEAAYVAAKMGAKTLLLSMSLDTIGKMSCNPAVGGTAKGHIVREIDALGGIIGKLTDKNGIQFRMLNSSKGAAVWSPRAQVDKWAYQSSMKEFLENTENLFIKQGTIDSLILEEGKLVGVQTQEGIAYRGASVIVSSGTFMRGLLHIGEVNFSGGRAGDKASVGLSKQLEELGFSLGRLKTGTPPRVDRRTIDFSNLEAQYGEEDVFFSYDPQEFKRLPQVPCYITHTSAETKKLVLDNLHRSPMYSGKIRGIGTRYCPSIEDKFVRFADKERHQLFLEPEGLGSHEFYVNGISSSLPVDVQLAMLHSVKGLEKAEVMRIGYAIEYDILRSGQLFHTLESKAIPHLYFAGQINGTTGYEEAAAQGLIAGINAALKAQGKPPFYLKRSEAYIGVLIDELITKEHTEPYRMFTSRAEFRLLLRQDNADLRLRDYGIELGLISNEQKLRLEEKRTSIHSMIHHLKTNFVTFDGKSYSLAQLLCRPEIDLAKLQEMFSEKVPSVTREVAAYVELDLKFEGYVRRQEIDVAKMQNIENIQIPSSIIYKTLQGLRIEAKEKLMKYLPATLGQASRISGISPADISVLRVHLESLKAPSTEEQSNQDPCDSSANGFDSIEVS